MVRWLAAGSCLLLLCGCGSCHQGTTPDTGEDADVVEVADVAWDLDVTADPDDPDVEPDPGPDTTLDTLPLDPPLDDGMDPELVDCHELDYGASDLGVLDLPTYDAVARTPIDCGPGCRQVSFAQGQLWSGEYDVWGDWLVMATRYELDIDHEYTRIVMVNLENLDHYLVDEENFKLDDRPGNLHLDLFQNRIIFQSKVNLPTADYDIDLLVYGGTATSFSFSRQLVFEYIYPIEYGGGMQSMDSWGDLVAWSDYRGSPSVIAVLDLATREECLVTGRGYGTGNPAVWDGKVVFHEGSLGHFNVFVYDGATGDVRAITGPTGDQFGADIWQDRVVWTDTHGEGTMLDQFNSDVYMHDLTTGETTAICTDPAMQPAPVSIFGDKVVWIDCRHDLEHADDCGYSDRTEIYMYDIATGTETRLTDLPTKKNHPKVYENRVYFTMDDTDGVRSIFEITLD